MGTRTSRPPRELALSAPTKNPVTDDCEVLTKIRMVGRGDDETPASPRTYRIDRDDRPGHSPWSSHFDAIDSRLPSESERLHTRGQAHAEAVLLQYVSLPESKTTDPAQRPHDLARVICKPTGN